MRIIRLLSLLTLLFVTSCTNMSGPPLVAGSATPLADGSAMPSPEGSATPTSAATRGPSPTPTPQGTVHELWTLPMGQGTGLAAGPWDQNSPSVLLSDDDGRLHVADSAGHERKTLQIVGHLRQIEIGRGPHGAPRLVGYRNWGDAVTVVDVTGKTLWSVNTEGGVDGAHWGDLDGDGVDELVVGMNGDKGIHVYDAYGQQKWANMDVGNVWNQAIVPARGKHPGYVTCSDASGQIYVFSARGNLLQTLQPDGWYMSPMSAGRVNAAGDVQIVAQGSGMLSVSNFGFDLKGRIQWSQGGTNSVWRIPVFALGDIDGDHVMDWVFSGREGWLTVVSSDGRLLVNQDLGFVSARRAVLHDAKGDIILVQGPDRLHALKFQPASPAPPTK